MGKRLEVVNTAQNVMCLVGVVSYDDTFIGLDDMEYDFGANIGAVDAKLLLTHLPQNAVILDGKVFVTNTFSAVPTKFQIGTLDNPTKFLDNANCLGTAGSYSLKQGQYFSMGNEALYLTLSIPTGQTKGTFFLYMTYVIPGRAQEITH